jgi:hypothetical protein
MDWKSKAIEQAVEKRPSAAFSSASAGSDVRKSTPTRLGPSEALHPDIFEQPAEARIEQPQKTSSARRYAEALT